MSHAVIGMFDTTTAAATAREHLIKAGIAASDIKVSGTTTATTTGSSSAAAEDKGFWANVKEMFTGEDEAEQHVGHYAEGARRGHVIVSVDATDANAHKVADILESAGALDVDEKATQWQATGYAPRTAVTATPAVAATARPATTAAATTTATAATTANAAGKIDLVKEDLSVGKRVVNRGGVRIVSKVISRPVEQDVTLREEHVSVDRRVVDRPLTGTALNDAFKGGTIELTESAEEAVVGKTARVVGEVVVGKTSEEHTQKVRDTLRETDVQVEKIPGQSVTSTTKVADTSADVTRSTTTKTNV